MAGASRGPSPPRTTSPSPTPWLRPISPRAVRGTSPTRCCARSLPPRAARCSTTRSLDWASHLPICCPRVLGRSRGRMANRRRTTVVAPGVRRHVCALGAGLAAGDRTSPRAWSTKTSLQSSGCRCGWVGGFPRLSRRRRIGKHPSQPPAAEREVARFALVIGDYLDGSGVRPLPKAKEEGKALAAKYPNVWRAATAVDLDELLEDRLTEQGDHVSVQVIHIACHGAVDPVNTLQRHRSLRHRSPIGSDGGDREQAGDYPGAVRVSQRVRARAGFGGAWEPRRSCARLSRLR